MVFEGLFEIGLIEEAGVGKAGADDMLIAANHLVEMLAVAISDADEVVHQAALGVFEGEITLVFSHDRHQRLARQFEIFGIKAAAKGGWRFDQVRHFGQQVMIGRHKAADFSGQGLRLGFNRRAALVIIQDDTLLSTGIEIGFEAGELGFGGAVGPQAAGDVSAGQAGEFKWNHGIAKHRRQPAHRPGKDGAGFVPAHGLAEFQPGDKLRQFFRQNFGGWPAGLAHLCCDIAAAIHRARLQVGHIQAFAAGKTQRGLGRAAIGIKGAFGRGALGEKFLVGLTRLTGAGRHDDAARRGIDPQIITDQAQFSE